MKWSAHLTFKKFLYAQVVSMPPVMYVFFLFLAVAFGPTSPDTTGAEWVGYVLSMIVLIGIGIVSGMWWLLRRMRKLAGTSTMHYEIDKTTLYLRAGKDTVSVPRTDFSVVRRGKYFLTLKRKRTIAGRIVVQFEDTATLEQALAMLGTGKPKVSKHKSKWEAVS